MHAPSSILLYGRNRELLRIRAMLFGQSNDFVTITTDEDFARQILGSHEINLLVLCQTLTQQEGDDIVATAKQTWIQTKVLALQGGHHGCAARDDIEVLDVLAGPAQLIEKVDTLLSTMVH